jgi:hypothetical protein
MRRKYELPSFLSGIADQGAYDRWLSGRAVAHVRRDRKRGNTQAVCEQYKMAIHRAVVASEGRDCYTGEQLAWNLISTYKNEASKLNGRSYKAGFALLPTVDHVGDGMGPADFVICSWRANDAKSDLPHKEFVEFCRMVARHHEGREP